MLEFPSFTKHMDIEMAMLQAIFKFSPNPVLQNTITMQFLEFHKTHCHCKAMLQFSSFTYDCYIERACCQLLGFTKHKEHADVIHILMDTLQKNTQAKKCYEQRCTM